jgi:hypothetical protein
VQVADDAVGLDRLVAHDLVSSARSMLIEPHDGRIVNALARWPSRYGNVSTTPIFKGTK